MSIVNNTQSSQYRMKDKDELIKYRENSKCKILMVGKGDMNSTNNAIKTSKYSILNFLPVALREQFRRNGNIYFLIVGILMFLGNYTNLFESSFNPWTTLGPLMFVVSISLAQQGFADIARHKSDARNNLYPCVVLRRSEDLDNLQIKRDLELFGGKDIKVRLKPTGFQETSLLLPEFKVSHKGNSESASVGFGIVPRKDIYPGDIVFLHNRDMIPADIILFASSGENGSVYVETSPIDGETNLKLRNSPHILIATMSNYKRSTSSFSDKPRFESLEQAIWRITQISMIGYPNGISSVLNPNNGSLSENDCLSSTYRHEGRSITRKFSPMKYQFSTNTPFKKDINESFDKDSYFVSVLVSEAPNALINTFSGRLILPPVHAKAPSVNIPLSAENMLLRGAMLRNTEWAIGIACFTGSDTKLVQNSLVTPSKFSRLDVLINRTVVCILVLMIACVIVLSGLADKVHNSNFHKLWYVGYNMSPNDQWPYLPEDLSPPLWTMSAPNYGQFVFTYMTLLSNFVPLSLYVTIELITLFMMYLIGWDSNMYDSKTDTPAVARSTIVTDLGQVQYVFSDKTGTLTQNKMKFKRCSVDGMIFGAPIDKASRNNTNINDEEINSTTEEFHPLKHLLVGPISLTQIDHNNKCFDVVKGTKNTVSSDDTDFKLTFNSEMFLRVMSICNTVVVEKNIDANQIKEMSPNDSSNNLTYSRLGFIFSRKRNKSMETPQNLKYNEDESGGILSKITKNNIPAGLGDKYNNTIKELPVVTKKWINKNENTSVSSFGRSPDGSPYGYAYQAESPDEGALVTAASLFYDFQLASRESDGVILCCSVPSLLSDKKIITGLKNGTLTMKNLAYDTASPDIKVTSYAVESPSEVDAVSSDESNRLTRTEKWPILAINKFDSDRKRMSVVVRSPPELGSLTMLLCKGADSSMLAPEVCDGVEKLKLDVGLDLRHTVDPDDIDGNGDSWEISTLLGIQAHLGAFASEGLRTLVLGVRVLSEEECTDWLIKYKEAASAITDRVVKLQNVANEIEKKLHIVGATAIEDKLQNDVPKTISNIKKAGIKLWVLTGDKKETAIEIGYSTKVLLPRMHVTEVVDDGDKRVPAIIATEFVKLIKLGKLSQYQHLSNKVTQPSIPNKILKTFFRLKRVCMNIYQKFIGKYFAVIGYYSRDNSGNFRQTNEDQVNIDPVFRRLKVRQLAEEIINDYNKFTKKSLERKHYYTISSVSCDLGGDNDTPDLDISEDNVPTVFGRAYSAKASIESQRSLGRLSAASLRNISIASITSDSLHNHENFNLLDEDTLSVQSFVPGAAMKDLRSVFDRKKRTILERFFAIDRDVRKGRLVRHLNSNIREELKLELCNKYPKKSLDQRDINSELPKALVVEGTALSYLLGNPHFEEMLFAIASTCDAVIACRVSPRQKAMLVKLVRHYVNPSPVTLAIGDGANDVSMIQEAQVGVGISGLEGQQAVNASDFSIAQFRFLEDLLLVHGRWNFMRMSKVVFFSFYKNATLVGILMVYSSFTLYSGTPLFDMWLYSTFNFVCAVPILFLGFFDRDLEKNYIKSNPYLFTSGLNNEHMSFRVTLRWIALCFLHVYVLYYLTYIAHGGSCGMTSAFRGLMFLQDNDRPGNGEGGDLKVFGTSLFSCLVFTMAYKVLYECRGIINGTCFTSKFCSNTVERYWSRLGYTWISVIWLSVFFYGFVIFTYQLVGRSGASIFSPFVDVANHVFITRSISWIIIIIVPIVAAICDVVGKVFSNMFYPTQTQIHVEIQEKSTKFIRKSPDAEKSH